MLPTARKLAFSDVPVVDLAPAWSGDASARAALADEIAEVCGRVGFMYIKNHRHRRPRRRRRSSTPPPTSTICRSTTKMEVVDGA